MLIPPKPLDARQLMQIYDGLLHTLHARHVHAQGCTGCVHCRTHQHNAEQAQAAYAEALRQVIG